MMWRRLFYVSVLMVLFALVKADVGAVFAHDLNEQGSACFARVGISQGGDWGEAFDDTAFALTPIPLRRIEVRYGNIVDTIEAFYGQESAGLHGVTNEDAQPSSITIAANDPLVQVSGYYGLWFGAEYILQLTFTTRSGKVFGPYGNMKYAEQMAPFTLTVGEGQHIAGFCGSNRPANNGQMMLLGSLGVIVADDVELSCSAQIGDPKADDWVMAFDDTAFARDFTRLIRLRVQYGNIVDTIEAFYETQSAGVHGVTNQDARSAVVLIAKDDALVQVSGYYGYWFGGSHILQLTFTTRSGKVFGPYGSMEYADGAIPFVLTVGEDQHIAGFCGSNRPANNGETMLLNSLGVIIAED